MTSVTPGLGPGVHHSACSGARGWVDTGDKPRHDGALVAISPPTDIVLGVALAAEPDKYRAAVEKLQRMSALSEARLDASEWQATLAREAGAAPTARPANPGALPTAGAPQRGERSSDAFGQLEAFVLQSFVKSMLPKNATHVFGKGTAGEVWKSMMAEKLGQQLARQRTARARRPLAQRPRRQPPRRRRAALARARRHPLLPAAACGRTCRCRRARRRSDTARGSEILMLRGHAPPFQPPTAARPGVPAPRPAEPVPIYLPLERAIERLEEVVDQETAALRSRAGIDLADFNNRKSQGLLDLNRALRSHDGLARDKAALARLAGLRAKLDANRAVLKTHLDAVREVANVLADAIRDTESDGTYSPGFRSGGWE